MPGQFLLSNQVGAPNEDLKPEDIVMMDYDAKSCGGKNASIFRG